MSGDKSEIVANEEVPVDSVSENGSDDIVFEIHNQRSISSKLSEFQALMNFMKGNIGTGLLSMPVVLRYCGLWSGFLLIFLAGSLATYLMHVLLRVSKSVQQRHSLDRSKLDYTETVFYVFKFGPEPLRKPKGKIKHTVNLFLIVTQIGFCCVYTLFITQNLRYFLRSFFPDFSMNFYLVGFLVCVLLTPLCLLNSMRLFSLMSVIANMTTLLGMILIFSYLFYTKPKPISSLPVFTDPLSFLIGFSIVMFSFEGISLVLPISNKMAHPEGYVAFFGVLNTGMTCVVCLNAAVAFFGFLTFGEEAEGSITLNVPQKPYWFAPIKPLFIISIVGSYILQFYVPASIFGRLMEKLRCHREASERRRYINLKVMRVCLVLFSYLMVVTIPKLELMISLIGSFASSLLAFILPPVLELVHLWEERHSIRGFWLFVFAKHMVIILIGLICFVGGTVATLIQLIHAFGNPDT